MNRKFWWGGAATVNKIFDIESLDTLGKWFDFENAYNLSVAKYIVQDPRDLKRRHSEGKEEGVLAELVQKEFEGLIGDKKKINQRFGGGTHERIMTALKQVLGKERAQQPDLRIVVERLQKIMDKASYAKSVDEIIARLKSGTVEVKRSEVRTAREPLKRHFFLSKKQRNFENPVFAGIVPKNLKTGQELLSLKRIVDKAGPTKLLVDVNAEFRDPKKTEEELLRLSDAGVEIVPYGVLNAKRDNPLWAVLQTDPRIKAHQISQGLDRALAGLEHISDEVNLIHYSETRTEARAKAPGWAQERMVFLAGKTGSAAYAISKIRALRKALTLKQGLPDLEITLNNGYHLISEAKAAWMNLQLAAQSYVAIFTAA